MSAKRSIPETASTVEMTNTVKSLFNVKPVLFALALPLMAAAPVQAEEPSNDRPEVRFETSHGDFSLELRPDVAPKTVENFLGYVDKGFYNGTIFHRVIADFMIQAAGLLKTCPASPPKRPLLTRPPPSCLTSGAPLPWPAPAHRIPLPPSSSLTWSTIPT